MLIGLTGHAGSGKDTAAAYLVEKHGFIRLAFADKLKDLAYRVNPWFVTCDLAYLVDNFGWDRAKREDANVRQYLQDLGQAARDTFGDAFWVDQVLTGDVFNSMRWGNRYVITDVRYQNEADVVLDVGGWVYRIERPGVGPANGHISEMGVLGSGHISNDSTVEELHEKLDKLIEEING